ncbi:MAG: tRNA glutamyl-Q(34) synthetase GluQRS [gamma proteobacterium symbiont of Bathyaustriella thionipta]|nr:tRNA glutamyl-Q(34) synthetase GluQRS [gamma proteobacterium symbiont of Bathyaustriella thionipta]
MHTPGYIGRFAPSPTGELHFGSLVAAVASFLDARNHQGQWLVRMEDVDSRREKQGAADQILRTLEAFGLQWDASVLYQSRREPAYQAALQDLIKNRWAYPCGCSRSEISRNAILTGPEGPLYPGTCRSGLAAGKTLRSWRFRVSSEAICFQDAIQGENCQNPAESCGDFVIRRADQLFAYQLAVVADDAFQGINHIVRGADLLASTARQIMLQKALGLATPQYAHLPLVLDSQGRKLSKQSRGCPLDARNPLPGLLQALKFLRQPLPPETPASLSELWQWAIANWQTDTIKAGLPI